MNVVVSDKKLQVDANNDGVVDWYGADVRSAVDMYPGGMLMPNRNFNPSEYRFGHNTQEKVDEISGVGNHYTAEFWEYDPRTIRRWNVDPIFRHWESPYAAFKNNPIFYSDPLGLEGECETCPKNADEFDAYADEGGQNYLYANGAWGYSTGEVKVEGFRPATVTTDAGHGDNNASNNVFDPGAVNGTNYEKDYALSVERSTNQWLQTFGVNTARTRIGDINVDPQGAINWRWQLANNRNSEVFVSFHLNSSTSNAAFAVYQQGAANEQESINLGNSIMGQLNWLFEVGDNSVVPVNDYTRYNTLGALNNFTGDAGVLLELGSISSVANRMLIITRSSDIGRAIATGVYLHLYGNAPAVVPYSPAYFTPN